ncbi:superoxide dismutase family protein [Lysobacter pythonis]|uniref:Superoxide dismutase [Cu-Zn] n=1 Tax=Solilutibacter pythonis TaxID=2483112 RepID=A0A3M2HJU6_9GAMM|nr:superoxide dismutase family protein [Lysobacter pythonis]RMH88123.1 superoxide dismutase family protein [Lysobacter pythonis]
MNRIVLRLVPLAAVLSLAACASNPPSAGQTASAHLQSKSGSQVGGVLKVAAMGDGVHVGGSVSGLKPNAVHAFHIHEKGDCSAADAASAGGHFNPTHQPHGSIEHGGMHHLGDQANLQTDSNGIARVDARFAGVSLGTGAANDVLGKAIVVHADPDDYHSQPAGNAGKRIACGVIR